MAASSFSAKHYPAPLPSGQSIPEGVRNALLSSLGELGIYPTTLWHRVGKREGLSAYQEAVDDFRYRFGDEAANHFDEKMSAHAQRDRYRTSSVAGKDYAALPALMALPEPLFLDVLEDGCALAEYSAYQII
jgi:hypothetical protein